MNTQHLQFMMEIERTRSISQAAENLYTSQPNLSRILHDVEQSLGFTVFERTSRGVRPTDRGVQYLQHVKNILRETEAIESLGKNHLSEERFSICIPRSAQMLEITADYLSSAPSGTPLNATVRECHPRQAFKLLSDGDADLAVIRFRAEYRSYFEEQAQERSMELCILRRFKYQLLMPKSHPLMEKQSIVRADLSGYPEIVHGDAFRPKGTQEESTLRQIYTVDRQAQITMLRRIPGAYMWIEPAQQEELDRWNLALRHCGDNPTTYYDALVFESKRGLNGLERDFLQLVTKKKA